VSTSVRSKQRDTYASEEQYALQHFGNSHYQQWYKTKALLIRRAFVFANCKLPIVY